MKFITGTDRNQAALLLATLDQFIDLDIEVTVTIPGLPSQASNPDCNIENFTYDPDGDYYICPEGSKFSTMSTLQ